MIQIGSCSKSRFWKGKELLPDIESKPNPSNLNLQKALYLTWYVASSPHFLISSLRVPSKLSRLSYLIPLGFSPKKSKNLFQMEGRRITASPRPCSGRRVVAKKRTRPDGFVNSVKKLQRREISSRKDRAFSISTAQERFRNMRLVVRVFAPIFGQIPRNC